MADEQSGPKPGHFLPGGDGEPAAEETGAPAPKPVGRPLTLGKAQPVRPPADPSLKRATPRPADPGEETNGLGGPPPAPLPGAPAPGSPLTGARQVGGARPVGWSTTSTRSVSQFSTEPPPVKPPRRFSRALVAGVSALAVLAISGGAVAGFRLIDSFGSTVESPLARPSLKPTEDPQVVAPLPQPTVTVTVTPVPDEVRVKQNKLYAVGKVPSVNCAEPSIKPNSQAAVLKYYQALLPCLNRAWEPLVRKAGYPFRPPKLQLATTPAATSCDGMTDRSYYCGDDETISMQWKEFVDVYKKVNTLAARVA